VKKMAKKTAKTKQEVAPKGGTAVAENNQAKPLGRGHEEELDRDDILIPRVKLLQALNPEVAEDPKKYMPGMLINSLTGEELPEVFIPIQKSTEWIFFNPRKKNDEGFNSDYDPGALIWRSTDRNDPHVQALGEDAWRHKFLHFLAYFPGTEMPVILSFSRTSMKAGKKLNTLTKFCGGDMFERNYKVASVQETNDQGTYFVLKVAQGQILDKEREEFKISEAYYNDFANKRVQVDVSDLGENHEGDDAKKSEKWT